MFSKPSRSWALVAATSLMSFCGSSLGDRIGLHGVDQWPLAGFAVGLLGLSYIAMWATGATLAERLKALESKVQADPR